MIRWRGETHEVHCGIAQGSKHRVMHVLCSSIVESVCVYVYPHYRKVKWVYDVHQHIFSLVGRYVLSVRHVFSQHWPMVSFTSSRSNFVWIRAQNTSVQTLRYSLESTSYPRNISNSIRQSQTQFYKKDLRVCFDLMISTWLWQCFKSHMQWVGTAWRWACYHCPFAGHFAIKNKTWACCWTKKLNKEDDGVDKCFLML